jgi:hypothetical protein
MDSGFARLRVRPGMTESQSSNGGRGRGGLLASFAILRGRATRRAINGMVIDT